MVNVTEEDLLKLTRQLYPTGRAWKLPDGATITKLHEAINRVQLEAVEGMLDQLNKILADNDQFTDQDATDWERRLQIFSNELTSLEDRKLAILRKYSHPGNIQARGHYLVFEGQLQAAGFDVFVHENNPANDQPSDFPFYGGLSAIQLGQAQLGQFGLGGTGGIDIVANYIEEEIDADFVTGPDLQHALFVGGAVKGDPADVPLSRKEEFRQLILNLKFVNNVVILFINYV